MRILLAEDDFVTRKFMMNFCHLMENVMRLSMGWRQWMPISWHWRTESHTIWHVWIS